MQLTDTDVHRKQSSAGKIKGICKRTATLPAEAGFWLCGRTGRNCRSGMGGKAATARQGRQQRGRDGKSGNSDKYGKSGKLTPD